MWPGSPPPPYVNVATSLLAQVDAAIGGKTGVNLDEGKNLVGAFWQPRAVLCDTEVLASLPAREWASGRGEMAKYALLAATVGTGIPPGAGLLDLPLEDQVASCVAAKAAVVADDEREGGRRAILNYGHTLAHALEAASLALTGPPDLRHGEAVAVGLVFAARLARRLGRVDDDRVALHRRVVCGFDLSPALPDGTDPEGLVAYMTRDKKARHDLAFVLDGPDGVEPVHGIDPDAVLATLAEMERAGQDGRDR
jgi:5-deoxy-5-amino-3-dehydroquinate synthase